MTQLGSEQPREQANGSWPPPAPGDVNGEGYAPEAEPIVVPDTPAELTQQSFLRKHWRSITALGASVLAVGGIIVGVSESVGSNKPKPVAVGKLNPEKTHTNNTPSNSTTHNKPSNPPNKTEILPSKLATGYINLAVIEPKEEVTLTDLQNVGDILPGVPVYLQDPKTDPIASVNADLANLAYALATSNDVHAKYALDDLSDVPTQRTSLETARNSWRASHPGKLLSFWSNSPVTVKSTENKDGSVTESVVSGTIYYDEVSADPDTVGWAAVQEHPATSKHKLGELIVTSRKWVKDSSKASVTELYRTDITSMQLQPQSSPIPDTLLPSLTP